jgi:DNA repair exonuclease SbcCD ATPase subunit
LTDREIIERLTRLEEGQNTLRAEIRANSEAIAQLRADMIAQFARVDAQFTRIDAQFTRIDGQFAQMQQLLLGIVGAFAAIVAVTIGFAIWDRRSMLRPFESKVKAIEDEISNNRQRLHALFEALRALSLQDQKVAEVLKRFDLL